LGVRNRSRFYSRKRVQPLYFYQKFVLTHKSGGSQNAAPAFFKSPNMKLGNREYIAIGVVAVVLLIAYKQGIFSKQAGQYVPPSVAGATDGSTPTLSPNQYENKATSIRTSLGTVGSGITGPLGVIVQDLDETSDADLIGIANAYAKKYPNDEYPTLYSIIDGTTSNYFSNTYTLKYKVLERLKKLGL